MIGNSIALSDAFFITKRSTFLNVLKNPLSMDEHLE
jgi:hypothetical protein